MSFLSELRRRNVFKIGVAYAVIAWLIIQLLSIMLPTFSAPEWMMPVVSMLILAGFPFVLLFTWAFEITPEGIKATKDVQASDSILKLTGKKINHLVSVCLALALLLVIIDAYVLNDDIELVDTKIANTEVVEVPTLDTLTTPIFSPALNTDIKSIPEKSIAVLPFVNLSSDAEQEYFADGLSEELLNRLAHIQDLQVTGRTSSFFYKGKNEDLRTIGETLGVAYILEGSIRKSGSQIRITAQLIKADDGFHLWSETFDRAMTDIFAIQDEIAEAVTTALSITLGAGEFNRIGMTQNIAAYEAYLLAIGGSELTSLTRLDYAEQAVTLDPDFALAWLALRAQYSINDLILPIEQTTEFAERGAFALAQAQAISGDIPEVMVATAMANRPLNNWTEADLLLQEVIERFGNSNFQAIFEYGRMLAAAGRIQDSLAPLQRAKRLDPLSRAVAYLLAEILAGLGRYEEALAEAERGLALEEQGEIELLETIKYFVSFDRGDRFAAADVIAQDIVDQDNLFLSILRAESTESALMKLEGLYVNPLLAPLHQLFLVHFAGLLGDPGLALEFRRRQTQLRFYPEMWMDHLSEMRQLEGFKELVRDAGMLDYWRTTGQWPDKCQPVGDDFECF